jgi:hypothetical protein
MKLWERSYVYGRHPDGTPWQRVDVDCYEQPFWAWARGKVFHLTLCRWFGRWHWNLVRTGGWPDTHCFELNEMRRVTRVHRFETDEEVPRG